MTKAIAGGILIGAVIVAASLAGWTYYDVAVNHKDMFGYAPVHAAGIVGAGIGGALGGMLGFVAEGKRRARNRP